MNRDLHDSWDRTRGHLSRAWVELPPGSGEDLAEYMEFLDHNELGLAMEALEAVGTERGAAGLFWAALADAATGMKLDEDARRYLRLAGRAPE